jgi:hypothetical protein
MPHGGANHPRSLARVSRSIQDNGEYNPSRSISNFNARANHLSQEGLIAAYRAINLAVCQERGLPVAWAERTAIRQARDLLGTAFVPSVSVPMTPPVTWDKRNLAEPESSDPIRFLDKYWGRYVDEGVLDQCTFRQLDPRLFEAIKWWCQKNGLTLATYLPPARRQYSKSNMYSPRPYNAVPRH